MLPLPSINRTFSAIKNMNMMTAVNSALENTLASNPKSVVLGEDVGFGGVFRCTDGLQEKFGEKRVFSTPLCEQGIIGVAIGLASVGITTVAEIQFADYIFPAYDQIVNEAAKYRYRASSEYDVGGLVIRTPCGAVGHGGHYHSQSPEAQFAHTPGLKVVMPRDPYTAKGLLLSSIAAQDPVIFMEPKALYRTSLADVPSDAYTLPLEKAEVLRSGEDITLIGWGNMVAQCMDVAEQAQEKMNVSIEVIDLQTLVPFDFETLEASLKKTGKCIITHEAPFTGGLGAEISATLQEKCFPYLEAPITRITGADTPFPLAHEPFYLPDKLKLLDTVYNLSQYN